MAITLQLGPEQEARLRTVARRLNVAPEALAETAVRDVLAQPDEAFLRLAQAIGDANRGLYERLR